MNGMVIIDGTIVKTKSGNVFPKDNDDWQLAFPQVPKRLREIADNDFKIVIFTNQMGLKTGKVQLPGFKRKIEAVCSKLAVPIQVYLATL